MRYFLYPKVVAVLLGALSVLIGWSSKDGQASQIERPVLFLRCEEVSKTVCQAMFQALAKIAPRHSIQITSKETQSETVLVILRLQKTVNALTGSLRWSSGSGALNYGPKYCIPSVITETDLVSHFQAKQFAEGLIKVTPDLQLLLLAGSGE